MSTAIEFNHVGKQYRLGLVGTGTLSHDLNRWWQTAIMHREDPYLKIGDVNDRSKAATSEYIWALRDIDFKVEQGDVVGIIGKNGAGKSTLLKLLSRVTAPTVGTINARGRIASLLEVGTGFHSEMTGRENIYMNGAILGMTKQEISAKLDEIIAFSGCEKYIDTPVKRYSSGMTVRLGFAVAAFLEPEILVVDEVLAVGDAEFQKKAIGKMQDVASGGRTVLFVSHNMGSIARLCTRGLVLNNGMTAFEGSTKESIDFYLNMDSYKSAVYESLQTKKIQVQSAKIMNAKGEICSQFTSNQELEVEINVVNSGTKTVRGDFTLVNPIDILVIVDRFDVPVGEHTFRVKISTSRLLPASYKIGFALDTPNVEVYEIVAPMLNFDVIDVGTQYSKSDDTDNGIVTSFADVAMIK